MVRKRTTTITLNAWFDADDGSIHIASPDADFISTVNAKPDSERRHRHLFANLARALQAAGLPAPDVPPRTPVGPA